MKTLVLTLLVLFAVSACSGSDISDSSDAAVASASDQGSAIDPAEVEEVVAVACDPYPSYSEGLFYIDDAEVPSDDVAEAEQGLPLFVRVTLVDTVGCERLAGRIIDIWSANPAGRYSGVVNPGDPDGTEADDERWLRARQATDDKGTIELSTIYPGWTPGSPPHLTMTTPISATESFTWRVVLDDAFSDEVYGGESYAARGLHTVRSSDAAEPGSVVTPIRRGDGALVEVVVAIDMDNLRQRPVSADVAGPSTTSIIEASDDGGRPESLDDVAQEVQEMFVNASVELGVNSDELFMAFQLVPNEPPPDPDEVARNLGVSPEALAQALPLLAAGAPTLD